MQCRLQSVLTAVMPMLSCCVCNRTLHTAAAVAAAAAAADAGHRVFFTFSMNMYMNMWYAVHTTRRKGQERTSQTTQLLSWG